MRNKINAALKEAMKAKDNLRVATLRLVTAAIKDRDIAMRVRDDATGVSDDEIIAVLAKMVKQRKDSAKIYEESGRLELAERESAEIEIIQEFMPKQLSDDEVQSAIGAAIAATGASSVRDIGKVMSSLKNDFSGRIDFGKVGGMVKSALAQ
jgi:uncharacterized protein YqeY